MIKQVTASHYKFADYVDQARWASFWHQLNLVTSLRPVSVLEVGPGPGYLKSILSHSGVKVTTLDPDPELQPSVVGSVTELPFEAGSFDVVCAFQVLEHLQFEKSVIALKEMTRVSKRNVIVSIPDASRVWRYRFYLPFIGERDFMIGRPFGRPSEHVFDGQHYWEVGKKGYSESEVRRRFLESANLKLNSTLRPYENPYHRFYVFDRV